MGIDSSVPQASIALLKDGHVLSQAEVEKNATVSNQILSLMDGVLSSSGTSLNDLDGFCLTTGPGSFTGLRVGASILKGLLLAVPKPFIKVDTLEALALQAMPTERKICAVLDARKKEVYTACFHRNGDFLTRLTPDKGLTPYQLCKEITGPTVFIGNGLDAYGPLLSSQLGKNFIPAQHRPTDTIAACTAKLGEKSFENKKTTNLSELKIKYVRKSEAELKLNKKNIYKMEKCNYGDKKRNSRKNS